MDVSCFPPKDLRMNLCLCTCLRHGTAKHLARVGDYLPLPLWGRAGLLPPLPLWGRVGVGGRDWAPLPPPTPALPHKGGGRKNYVQVLRGRRQQFSRVADSLRESATFTAPGLLR